MKRLFLTFFLLCAAPVCADELRPVEILMLQHTLREHGFLDGELDGKIGPATRKAIKDFSLAYGAPNDPFGAYWFSIQESIKNIRLVTKEPIIDAIKSSLRERLLDHSSVSVKDIYYAKGPKLERICGTLVDTKGREFRFMGVEVIGDKFILMQLDTASDNMADMICSMTFPPIKNP